MNAELDPRGLHVHVGATLGRRFVLMRSESYDLPGVERYVAHDNRLNTDVVVDLITTAAPSAVRSTATRSMVVRDPRIARVIATGRERLGSKDRVYVVSQQATGLSLDTVLATKVLPVPVASAVFGEVARALSVAHAKTIIHGAVRASSISVTARGHALLTGLGIDGELATQAGRSSTKARKTAIDAAALAELYVLAITGIEASDATEDDLPSNLSPRAREMCGAVIRGSGPQDVTAIAEALSPFHIRYLRSFASQTASFDLRPALMEAERVRQEEERLAVLERARRINESIALDPQAVAWGATIVESWEALARLQPGAWAGVRAEIVQLAPHSAVEVAGESEGLDLFEAMRAEQTANLSPAVWEELLDRLHRWWPRSETLTKALARAHRRAQRSGPIKAGPLLMATGVVATVVAAMVAFSMMGQPFEPQYERFNPPTNTYPPFTISPPAESTLSPTASPSPTQD